MVSDQRSQLRVAVHYGLTVRHEGREGRGKTENLSERGAMISVEFEPPLTPGDEIDLDIELDGLGTITVPASVKWASTVLPGMTGIEFDPPVLPELIGHIAQLLAGRMDEAHGF